MFDFSSDLHFDNAMMGGPVGWLGRIDVGKYKNPGSTTLLIAGDTSESLRDTVDFLNAAAEHYEWVVAVLGNHEKADGHAVTRKNVRILDLCGHEFRMDGTAYLGGCLEDDAAVEVVARKLTAAQNDPEISRVIVLSHFAPTPRLCALAGRDFEEKCNGLLGQVGPPLKDTKIVFGHVHLPFDLMLDGYRLLADPRGYKGIRRDGSAWSGKVRHVQVGVRPSIWITEIELLLVCGLISRKAQRTPRQAHAVAANERGPSVSPAQ